MIECSTGRFPLAYVGYGCYCGIGGKGIPKDKTDWCCHRHDCCYGIAEQVGCLPKSDTYDWSCTNDMFIKCGNTNDYCQRILCYCDKRFAECLEKVPYNNLHALYPNFLCGTKTPPCSLYKEQHFIRRKKVKKVEITSFLKEGHHRSQEIMEIVFGVPPEELETLGQVVLTFYRQVRRTSEDLQLKLRMKEGHDVGGLGAEPPLVSGTLER
ncbi:PREDICTED: group 10 secretory phospholipase A2-like [Nanorana parkeri]|uniref:group 10 secretory phospholipase A2-like n=1 Tax=Nanorana parkeri TaxID=125878 RepID=UPI000853FF83|nr:PREDICTED: group 10 secretory phospholipase A2-like [Nanorana parkeri]